MSIFDYIFGDTSRPSPRDSDPTVHTGLCERCKNPFNYKLRRSGKQRDSIEYEPLAKKLMLPPGTEVFFCDGCFLDTMTQETRNPMSTGLEGEQVPVVQRLTLG